MKPLRVSFRQLLKVSFVVILLAFFGLKSKAATQGVPSVPEHVVELLVE
jgi:hypothetical protein